MGSGVCRCVVVCVLAWCRGDNTGVCSDVWWKYETLGLVFGLVATSGILCSNVINIDLELEETQNEMKSKAAKHRANAVAWGLLEHRVAIKKRIVVDNSHLCEVFGYDTAVKRTE